ncbi:hypothetical protein N7476_004774 [Penicillium atrosanguineum]|uniref:Uncharacterized protein n=1 Tax=Penicillium atrosanguineum TaxID=1132637 RepID=A0A9W9U4V2_9EURO|nr:hypothetical protein N7476_004774 [Penicillium atrosanguineum]
MGKTCHCTESGWLVLRLRMHEWWNGELVSKELKAMVRLLQKEGISSFLIMSGFASERTSWRPPWWPNRWQRHQGIGAGWHVFLSYYSLDGWEKFPYQKRHKVQFVRTIDEAQQCAEKWLARELYNETIMASFRGNCFVLQSNGTADSEAGRRYEEFLQQHDGLPFQDDTRECECRQHPEGESLPDELGSSRALVGARLASSQEMTAPDRAHSKARKKYWFHPCVF